MKPRTLKTYKILAVALTTAGCSSATGGEVAGKPVIAAEGSVSMGETPMPPARPAAEAAVALAPSPRVTIAPEPTSQDPALLALREELYAQNADEALPTPAHFQPLCDKDGYPLVGNVMRKTPHPGFQPSAFCAGLRAQAGR